MSELIETGAPPRNETLEHLILELHSGAEAVQRRSCLDHAEEAGPAGVVHTFFTRGGAA